MKKLLLVLSILATNILVSYAQNFSSTHTILLYSLGNDGYYHEAPADSAVDRIYSITNWYAYDKKTKKAYGECLNGHYVFVATDDYAKNVIEKKKTVPAKSQKEIEELVTAKNGYYRDKFNRINETRRAYVEDSLKNSLPPLIDKLKEQKYTTDPTIKAANLYKMESKGDELLGTKSSIILYATGINIYPSALTGDGFFMSFHADNLEVFDANYVTIGLYTADGKLQKRYQWDARESKNGQSLDLCRYRYKEHLFHFPSNQCTCSMDQRASVSYLWDFIMNVDGYFRIVASEYSGVYDHSFWTVAHAMPKSADEIFKETTDNVKKIISK